MDHVPYQYFVFVALCKSSHAETRTIILLWDLVINQIVRCFILRHSQECYIRL